MHPDPRLHFQATCTDTAGQEHTTDLFGKASRMTQFARTTFRSRGVQVARGSVVVRQWTAAEVEAYQVRMRELKAEWSRAR